MGACVLFTWPSFGTATGYLPDRAEARASAPALTQVLIEAMDQITRVQRASARAVRAEITAGGSVDESALLNACKAKTSIIAHSMGNYLMQLAMAQAWTTFNRPQLLSLVNQYIMVAADVDNDLFASGETQDDSDGSAIANLCYRVTSLYSGADSVLGLSAGVKHFGKRRLGRSGLAKDDQTGVIVVPDNVWQIDCTPAWRKNESNIHSAYFENPRTLDVMRQVLKGVDRGLIEA
jgi:esterase/lipase superfamily enzyme